MTEKELNIISDYFNQQPIKRAYLFGSHARKEDTKYSDLDIMIVLDHNQKIGLIRQQIIKELEVLLSKQIDVVIEENISDYFKEKVEKDKLLIFENQIK